MPTSGENIRFQVLINGRVKATAGMESAGVLSAIIDWVRRDPAAMPDEVRLRHGYREADWIGKRVRFSLSGLDLAAKEHVSWFAGELRPGDEVTVRVLPAGGFDPPKRPRGRRAKQPA